MEEYGAGRMADTGGATTALDLPPKGLKMIVNLGVRYFLRRSHLNLGHTRSTEEDLYPTNEIHHCHHRHTGLESVLKWFQ